MLCEIETGEFVKLSSFNFVIFKTLSECRTKSKEACANIQAQLILLAYLFAPINMFPFNEFIYHLYFDDLLTIFIQIFFNRL